MVYKQQNIKYGKNTVNFKTDYIKTDLLTLKLKCHSIGKTYSTAV